MTAHATLAPPPIGWPLLPVPDADGGLGWPTLDDSVRQGIRVILTTRPGEQLMRPEFGAGLDDFVHEPNTLTTRTAMREDITAALERWEPRIRLTNVAVTPGEEPSLVWIEIAYVRLADLRADNLVYPFYLK